MKNKMYVGNLSFQTSDTQLTDAFSAYGTVLEVNLITDRETGRARGFGFVTMSSDEEAQAAVEGMDGQELDGRQISVNIAKPREERSGGGGGRGGYGGGGGGGRGGYGGGGGRDRGRGGRDRY